MAFVCIKPSSESVVWQKDLYNALIAETGLKSKRFTLLAKASFDGIRKPDMESVSLERSFMDSAANVSTMSANGLLHLCSGTVIGQTLIEDMSNGATFRRQGIKNPPPRNGIVPGWVFQVYGATKMHFEHKNR